MEKNNNKMRAIAIGAFIVLPLILCFLFSYDTDYVDIWPKEISFNYEAGNTDDAVDICKNYYYDIEVPEYIYSQRDTNFAYIADQSDRKIKVKFDSDCDSMHLLINISVNSGIGFGF